MLIFHILKWAKDKSTIHMIHPYLIYLLSIHADTLKNFFGYFVYMQI